MRRINRNRGKQQVQLALAVILHEGPRGFIEFVQAEDPDTLLRQLRAQLSVPALVLLSDEFMHFLGDCVPLFYQRQSIGAGFGVAIFHLLHQTGDPHFEKFVQIVGADREKLQAFQQRAAFILRFFKHAMVELKPRKLAVDVVSRIVNAGACHDRTEESTAQAGRRRSAQAAQPKSV
jgi:hypothetical protein